MRFGNDMESWKRGVERKGEVKSHVKWRAVPAISKFGYNCVSGVMNRCRQDES